MPNLKRLLSDGSQIGMRFSYEKQEKPNGIAEAFLIGEDFIQNDDVTLILGDNIFGAIDFKNLSLPKKIKGGVIFGYAVPDPEKYGVIEFNRNKSIKRIIEKPNNPKSNIISPGLYIYNNKVIDIAKNLKPSRRGELEITDINKYYLNKNQLKLIHLNLGTVWLDAGNSEALFQAAQYVKTIQERHNILLGSPEITSFNQKWISKNKLKRLISEMKENDYKSKLIDFFKKI